MSERFITISRSDSSTRKPNTDTIVEQPGMQSFEFQLYHQFVEIIQSK